MRAFASELRSGLGEADVRAIAGRYPLLRTHAMDGYGLVVSAPPRLDFDNWVALVRFSPAGTLTWVGFGTPDYAPLRPKYAADAPPEMPQNLCFADAKECARHE